MNFDFSKTDRATPGQLDYILVLIAKVREEGDQPPVEEDSIEELTFTQASELIDDMKDLLGWN